MARSDYRRPSADQIMTIYRCMGCGHETETDYGAPRVCPFCGDNYRAIGESWPADPDDWHESRHHPGGPWRDERRLR